MQGPICWIGAASDVKVNLAWIGDVGIHGGVHVCKVGPIAKSRTSEYATMCARCTLQLKSTEGRWTVHDCV